MNARACVYASVCVDTCSYARARLCVCVYTSVQALCVHARALCASEEWGGGMRESESERTSMIMIACMCERGRACVFVYVLTLCERMHACVRLYALLAAAHRSAYRTQLRRTFHTCIQLHCSGAGRAHNYIKHPACVPAVIHHCPFCLTRVSAEPTETTGEKRLSRDGPAREGKPFSLGCSPHSLLELVVTRVKMYIVILSARTCGA